jgi:hypothetical protein
MVSSDQTIVHHRLRFDPSGGHRTDAVYMRPEFDASYSDAGSLAALLTNAKPRDDRGASQVRHITAASFRCVHRNVCRCLVTGAGVVL